MADAVISYTVRMLGDFLIQQASLLLEIKDDVLWLQRELGFVQSYLQDAEQKQRSNASIRTWISELQDIAYDSEDTFKIFIFRVNKEQIHSSTCGRMSSSVTNCFCCICKNVKLCGIGKDIKKLKERVREINRQRVTYGINGTGITHIGDLTTTTSNEDDDLVFVGFIDEVQLLQKKLFNGDQNRCVISILGMGGLGKTTIARKLYNNNNSSENFTLRAWICVSQEWNTDDLHKQLIKSFKKLTSEERTNVDNMGHSELERHLRDLLEEHKYLVVIDHVWHTEVWENIKKAFPDNKKGSRIIITTRKEDVAALLDRRTYVHKLRFLGEEESWLLFCNKAFTNENGECSDNFKALAKEMMKKCAGLPLAIVVLGKRLWGKEFHEWMDVKNNIWREVKENSMSVISPLLDLSYNDLPFDIKSCFLYLGIFPEGASIDVEELVKLWVAEELIPIEEGRTPKEVSECYFKELLKRNLVQTVKRNWRMTSSCRVHGLLRYLALTKERETNFLRVCDEIASSTSLSSTSCRRFAVYSGDQREELLNRSHKKVRTLYFLNDNRSIHYKKNEKINVSIVWSFKLLRVLKIEGVDLRGERKSKFFEVVGEMIQLGYFGLKDTFVNELPNSIKNLEALQTLYIKPIGLSVMLPKGICKLKELRHLEGHFSVENLHYLAGLTNLQTLKVMIQNKTSIEENSHFLATLKNLRTLEMQPSLFSNTIPIERLFNCKELIELKIMGGGTIREVPNDIHNNLTKLNYLELFLSEPEKDPISKLEMLPSLVALHLSYHPGKTISWTFKANGFPQLKFLKLGNASKMELSVAEEAMPELQFLCLENDELKQSLIPERLRSLPGEEAMNWKFYKY